MADKKDEMIAEVAKTEDEGSDEAPKKGRRWVFRHECEGPFSGINLTMAMISTRSACEEMGFAPRSKNIVELLDDYHRGPK